MATRAYQLNQLATLQASAIFDGAPERKVYNRRRLLGTKILGLKTAKLQEEVDPAHILLNRYAFS